MTTEKITPQNVTFKNLEVGFGHDMGGLSGIMYFGETKVAEFYADGWSGTIDDITFYSDKYEAQVIAYQKEKETHVYLQSPDMFINSAIQHTFILESIKDDLKKEFTKFKKKHSIQDKETIGAFVFLEEDTYGLTMHNNAPKVMTPSALETEKNRAKASAMYKDSDNVYLLKYISPRKMEFTMLK